MTSELNPGEHPSITKPLVVLYKDARVLFLNKVEEMLVAQKQKIVCAQKAQCSDQLLEKIQKALPASPAKKDIKAQCQAS
jgi:hypothetical protein